MSPECSQIQFMFHQILFFDKHIGFEITQALCDAMSMSMSSDNKQILFMRFVSNDSNALADAKKYMNKYLS